MTAGELARLRAVPLAELWEQMSIDKRPNGKYRARVREYRGGPERTKQFARKVDASQELTRAKLGLSNYRTGCYNPALGWIAC